MIPAEQLTIGQKVIYERYGFKVGTITRIGKTVALVEDGYVADKEPRVELRDLYPATPESLQRLADLKQVYEEKEVAVQPFDEKIELLRKQIRRGFT